MGNEKLIKKLLQNNLFIAFVFSLLVVFSRYLFIFTKWEIFFGIDVLLFLVFGVGIIIIYKKKKENDSWVKTLFIPGTFQIISSIFIYELCKLLFFQPEITFQYIYTRAIASISVLIIGLFANTLFLVIYRLFVKENISPSDNSDILDTNNANF